MPTTCLRSSGRSITSGLLCALFTFTAIFAGADSNETALVATEVPFLEPNKPVERQMTVDDTHSYSITLNANQFLLLIVDQRGFDVIVRLYSPAGDLIEEVDRLGTVGPEVLSAFVTTSGTHRIEVAPFDVDAPEPGAYAIEVKRLEKIAKTAPGKIDQLMSRFNLPGTPGGALAVVKDGEVLLALGYGLADLEHGIPITPRTVFDIASVSKQFTGLAVAMLVQQGKLSLDDDYRKRLPEMPDYGPKITLNHLIHHTSGIRDWPGTLAISGWDMGDVISFEQILTLARNLRELNFTPGNEYAYSNTNYNLLAETVSRVTGKPFQDWMAENVFAPLGMNHTHVHHDESQLVPNRAYAYDRDDEGNFERSPNNLTAMGSSSIFTTVEDMARWAINFETARVGGREAIELMHQRIVLNDGNDDDYAFGIIHGEYRSLPTVAHAGGWASFRTFFLRFPEQRLAVIALGNTDEFNSRRLAQRVAEFYLEEEMVAAEKARAAQQEQEQPPIDGERLEEYAGLYQFDGGLLVTVERDGQRLLVRRRGRGMTELLFESGDTFSIANTSARLVFRRNDQGELVGAVLHQGGELVGVRVEPVEPGTADLAQYAGRYFSDELEAFYTLVVDEGELIARNRRHGRIALSPIVSDVFRGERWFLDTVVFERDDAGTVHSMLVSADERSRNLKFERQIANCVPDQRH